MPPTSLQGIEIARSEIVTVIGRKTSSKGREYTRVWIYVPTKVTEDTAFPFRVGDPCQIEIGEKIGEKEASLTIRPVSVARAVKEGWAKRARRSAR